jgi:23S rRNA (uracil1939-C5)-methyltransferase
VQPEAVEQGLANAGLNGIDNVEFRAGQVEELLPQVAESLETWTPDVVVLDPPRQGMRSRRPRCPELPSSQARIAYMSCNPATLARDLKVLREQGGYVPGKGAASRLLSLKLPTSNVWQFW